jgi:hypothetical protein
VIRGDVIRDKIQNQAHPSFSERPPGYCQSVIAAKVWIDVVIPNAVRRADVILGSKVRESPFELSS